MDHPPCRSDSAEDGAARERSRARHILPGKLTSPTCKWDVVGIGENSVDLVARVPALPVPRGAGKVQIASRRLSCGGQTATAMCACAALGLRVKYVGATGADENGRLIRNE